MSCEQVEEFDETTAAKDREIAELKQRLADWMTKRGCSTTPSPDGSIAELPIATLQSRKGKVPPMEPKK